jgi:serine/threonine protein kinase
LAAAPHQSSPRLPVRAEVDPLVGTVLDGDFEVVQLIGSGSHADVYQSRQKSVGQRVVALKVLSRLYLGLPEGDRRRAATMLQREGELLGGLHSSCFVDVYRAGTLADGRPYIAIEYAEGPTLSHLLQGSQRLDLDALVELLHQWADGLAELHERGWIHRDVTPANAVIATTAQGIQRLMTYDLGTATQRTERADRFRVGHDKDRPPGTPAYMSPEQAAGAVIDGRSDQFALASIAYEALAGTRAVVVNASGLMPLLEYLRGTGPIPTQPLHTLRDDLPPEVEAVLLRALDRDPARRYADVRSFVAALSRGSHASARGSGRKGLLSRWFGGGER